ncbi:Uncharacterised protein [Vibrio cholerae]|nr:Uncharacterised protein [Vibrio cholerae]CSC20094.1 Uncharacterised protein [Vibrio cholerae]CSC99293.1 Uncharacterised protein [Vibrio cholerae]CSI44101.1 Uncharacterised protein [Vibrio cholerae]
MRTVARIIACHFLTVITKSKLRLLRARPVRGFGLDFVAKEILQNAIGSETQGR